MAVTVELPSREELAELSAGGLEQALLACEQARRAVEAAYVAVLDVAEQRGVHADDGHSSVKTWMRTLTGISGTEATRRVQTMHAVRSLPSLRDGFEDGTVGVDQVRVLARLHANPRCAAQLPDSEELLVAHAVSLGFDELCVVARRWEQLADAEGAHRDHEHHHRCRDAHLVQVGDAWQLDASCGAAQGVALRAVFDRFVEAELVADWDAARAHWGDEITKDRLARTDAQRRFDALHAVFLAAVSTAPGAQAPEPVVNIVMDREWFEAELRRRLRGGGSAVMDPATVNHRRCETTTGVRMDPTDVVEAAIVGHVRRVVIDSAGVVVEMGRKRRLFTGAAREAVLLADSRCIWGACGVAAEHCQIDHSLEWARDGTTDPRNGGPGCGRHNRFKNRGYTVHRQPDGTWLILRPDGTPITHPRAA